MMRYNGGRNNGGKSVNGGSLAKRKPIDENGNAVWNRFSHLKLSLVSVGATDWNVRSEWSNVSISDFRDR